jgi:hypothetical protein
LKYSPATWKTSLLSKLPQKIQKNKQKHCSTEKTGTTAHLSRKVADVKSESNPVS